MNPEIAQMILQDCGNAYAIVNGDLTITETGGAIQVLPHLAEWPGRSLPDQVPELVGNEDTLADVLDGRLPRFQLERINRLEEGGDTRYLTITVLPYLPEGKKGKAESLLVTFTDVTEQGRFAQMLAQKRNELRLLQRDLAQANAQLDFLLRRYVPDSVADALLARRLSPRPGGELRHVSILFADLRGYSHLAEMLSPSQTMAVLNECLTVACDAIAESEGTIAQFMGDAVMALFNAPTDQPDHARRAVQAGLDIQAKMAQHRLQTDESLPPLHFGVGIQSGPAVVGNTGAHWRYDYSAIGDTTNVAYRICTTAQGGEVLIGPETREQLRDTVTVTPLAPMRFKGRERLIPIYRVQALKGIFP